ncbi:UPF0763 protein [Campylobacterota bacterium]|nr:UPF0763 protein [Campylobacterota bacterium]
MSMKEAAGLEKATLQKIEEVASSLDLSSSARTIIKIGDTTDPKKKTLELISGEWDTKKPWFVIDDGGKVYALTSVESFMRFIHSLHAVSSENFSLKLEKAIWRNFPIDFGDVWAVAIGELEGKLAVNHDTRILEVDIETLVERIRKEHPNLFYHLTDEPMGH